MGEYGGGRVAMQEVHRFLNEPVEVNGSLYWDVLRLFHEVKRGIAKAEAAGGADSIGVDTWGVDFGLLDGDGQLLSDPLHYRSPQAADAEEGIGRVMPLSELYKETGIAFNKYNTLCRLALLRQSGSAALKAAKHALFMPDLFTYFLTGNKVCEHSIASTSGLLRAGSAEYSGKLLKAFGLKKLFPRIVPSGTVAGELRAEIVRELHLKRSMPVIATLGHDTASAFFAASVGEENAAVLSSGTWSLLGTVLNGPIVTEAAAAAGYTNEIGYGGKVRFLRNIVGLWIIQECKRSWEKEGRTLTFAELAAGAEQCAAGRCFIDPDAEEFYSPHDMPKKIAEYCRRTGQYVPQTVFETARCVYDSLARSYKKHLAELERRFAGYNMLVTSELKLNDRTVYGIYHNLWRIEQSFRMMKSYLDARPVYLTGMNSIKGHFLICYISVVLERLLEFKVLGSRFSHERIMDFIRSFSLVRLNSKDYINLLTSDDEVGQFLADTILPEVTNYILSPADVTKLLKVKLKKRIDDC